jgi:YHS domain-containing protein
MKTIARTVLALILLSSSAFAGDLINVAGASRVALNGYDPVAFFTDAKPVIGSPFIRGSYQGAEYFFATEGHKTLFLAKPEKYAPQYGGYCAYGVSVEALAPVDINTWQIRDGKLYLNFSDEFSEKFNADFNGNVAKAERNWPGLVKKYSN